MSSGTKLVIYEETLTKLLEFDRIELESEVDRTVLSLIVHQPSIDSPSAGVNKKRAGTLLRSSTMDSGTSVNLEILLFNNRKFSLYSFNVSIDDHSFAKVCLLRL